MHPWFLKLFFVEAADIVLKKSVLIFDSNYLQTQGTTTGTLFPPTYSTFTTGYHKQKVYSIIGSRFGLNTKQYFMETDNDF